MKIPRFHCLTQDLDGVSHRELAHAALLGGAKCIQLRTKGQSLDEWVRIARDVGEICEEFGATFIVNDSVDVALRVKAHGVHLGKGDWSPKDARAELGANAIIGGSANTFADIKRLVQMDVDYIGLGPFKYTTTKGNLSPVLGLEGIQKVVEDVKQLRTELPIIAIGGIAPRDVPFLLELGVYGVAVSAAVNLAKDRVSALKEFVECFRRNDYAC